MQSVPRESLCRAVTLCVIAAQGEREEKNKT